MKTTIATKINNMLSPTGGNAHTMVANIAFAVAGNETPLPAAPQGVGADGVIDPQSFTPSSLGFVVGTLSVYNSGNMIDPPTYSSGSMILVSFTPPPDGTDLAFHS